MSEGPCKPSLAKWPIGSSGSSTSWPVARRIQWVPERSVNATSAPGPVEAGAHRPFCSADPDAMSSVRKNACGCDRSGLGRRPGLQCLLNGVGHCPLDGNNRDNESIYRLRGTVN